MRVPAGPATLSVTPSASWPTPTTSAPRTISTPSCPQRTSSTRSVRLCGAMSMKANRLGISVRSSETPALSPAVETMLPLATSSSANPRASSSSRVLAATPNALVMLGNSARFSSTVHAIPASASSWASIRPVGPAPTTITRSLIVDSPSPV